MKKLALPRSRQEASPSWVEAVTQNIEVITGRYGRISKLPANADLSDVIAKINELLDRLQQ
jgi:hypothetical protein